MSEHTVICRDCEPPRRWRENCVHCAEDQADKHRHETGHQAELNITQNTAMRLINDCRTMRLTQRRGGW